MLNGDQLDAEIEQRQILLENGICPVGMKSEGTRRRGFRSKILIRRIVWLVAMREDGCPWVELLAQADPDDQWTQSTIDGTIRDLVVFGAVWVKGRPAGRGVHDERTVHLTDLGADWMRTDPL